MVLDDKLEPLDPMLVAKAFAQERKEWYEMRQLIVALLNNPHSKIVRAKARKWLKEHP